MEERLPVPSNAPSFLVMAAFMAALLSLVAFGGGRVMNWTWRYGAPETWKRVRAMAERVERRLARYTFTRRIFFVLAKSTPHDMGFWLYKNYEAEASETVPPPPASPPAPGRLPATESGPDRLDEELDRVLKQLASMARTRALIEGTDKKRLLETIDKIRKMDGAALNRILEAVDRLRMSDEARKKLARSILGRENVRKVTGLKDEDLVFVFRDMDLKRMQALMKEKGARALELHVREEQLRLEMERRRKLETEERVEAERRERRPAAYFTALYEDYERHSLCMKRLAHLDRSLRRWKENLPPDGTDLSAFQSDLLSKGLVEEIQRCPNGGRFDLSQGRTVCTTHGNELIPHERLEEYRRQLYPFLSLRDRYGEARERLGPEGEKACKEIRASLETLLKEAPNHPYGHELLGRILIDAEDWNGAILPLRKALEAFPRNRAIAYRLALCLYAREETKDLQPLLDRALQSPFEAPPSNFGNRLAWYVMGDRCIRMGQALKAGLPFPALRKKLAEATASQACREAQENLKKQLQAWAKAFPGNSRQLARIVEKLRTLRKEHDALDPNDMDVRPRRQRLAHAASRLEERRRACLQDRSSVFFGTELALGLKEETLRSCPDSGRFGITESGALECTKHPGILQANWVGPLFKKLAGEDLARANRGLLLGQLKSLPKRRRCYLIQKKLQEALRKWRGQEGPTAADLAKRARLKDGNEGCPDGGRWIIEGRGARAHLRCSVHDSSEAFLGLDEAFLRRQAVEDEESQ